MNRKTTFASLAAALAFGGLAAVATPAAAMPLANPAVPAIAADVGHAQPEQVRWVCNRWGRCWWRGPGFYRRPWGWRRHGWHRGWRRHHGWRRHW